MGESTWYTAFIYEPGIQDKNIDGIAYYCQDSISSSNSTIEAQVYGSSNTEQIDELLWSGEVQQAPEIGWQEIIIPSAQRISIGSYNYYWIVLKIEQSESDSTYIGTDSEETVDNANLVKINESWEKLSDYGINGNWLLECLISQI